MKRFLSYAMCAAAVCLAACSQDETFEQVNADSHVISFRASLPQDAMMTKADNNVKRYVMQLVNPDGGWVDLDASEDVEASSLTNATGEFQIDGEALGLQVGGTYTVMFWADYDDGVYGADWLWWVTLPDKTKPLTMAYCGRHEFVYGEDTETSIVLKRAVAKVNLIQKTAQTPAADDQIVVKYSGYSVYDLRVGGVPAMGTGESPAAKEDLTTTIDVPDNLDAGATIGSILVFAGAESEVTNFTFTYAGNNAFEIQNVPLQANYQTNINGDFVNGPTTTDYDFTVTTGDAWDGAIEGDEGQGGETGEGEEGEQGGEETTDTTKPTFGDCSATATGATINYSIVVNDETSLNGGRIEIHLKDSSWTQVGETVTVNFDDQTGTTKTITGSFTATTSGTYIVDWTAWDAAGNEEYKNVTDIVVTVEAE